MAKGNMQTGARGRVPEHAVVAAPENTARALTLAEAEARRRLQAIRTAEQAAQAELEARRKA